MADMRALLGLGDSISDADVADAYAAYLNSLSAPVSAIVGVDELREHLRVGDEASAADLQALEAAALRRAEGYTNNVLSGAAWENLHNGDRALVMSAIKIMVASLWENRGGETADPPAFRALLSSLIRYSC